MDPKLKTNLLNFQTYQRFALMLVFVLIYSVVELVIYAVALFQIVSLLVVGAVHDELRNFSRKMTAFAYDILTYLTFEHDKTPFPFQPWGYGTPCEEETQESEEAPKPKPKPQPKPKAAPVSSSEPAKKPRKPRVKKTPEDEMHA